MPSTVKINSLKGGLSFFISTLVKLLFNNAHDFFKWVNKKIANYVTVQIALT